MTKSLQLITRPPSRSLPLMAAAAAVSLIVSACGATQAVDNLAETAAFPKPFFPPYGTATNLAGNITKETPVYAGPGSASEWSGARIWTLTPGTRVTAICQETSRAVYASDSYTSVSWAPGKSGFIYRGGLEIATRTPDTNESVSAAALKPCGG
ncbi:hypothetical protein [Mycolicibacterium tusciae]|uniref:Ig-like domain-containing protein n=1 Tax=Mycolicibacterium tusciae TaxID=75922 RepID=A0A1X0JDR2_9MYCO|nr:hypothetical protein [Mycolicibacterium tusciae]ORB60666.1 hypothetical protein BST47_29560 [Mycolicibacterium tusciae]